MIQGVHTMFYSSEPEALRAFLRDRLGFPATDIGDGWLIFDLPEADMGCHPAEGSDGRPSGTHYISFYCDDTARTVAELQGRGVRFTDQIADAGCGLATISGCPEILRSSSTNPNTPRESRSARGALWQRTPQRLRRQSRKSWCVVCDFSTLRPS